MADMYVIWNAMDGKFWRRGAGSPATYGATSGWSDLPTVYDQRTAKLAIRVNMGRMGEFARVRQIDLSFFESFKIEKFLEKR